MIYIVFVFGLIALILWIGFKLIRLIIRIMGNGLKSVQAMIPRLNHSEKRVVFPEYAFPTYSISQSDFTRIVNKTAYRHPRVEDVEVINNTVAIKIASQTGLSRSHATLTFRLSGSSIGNYTIKSDNGDSTIPNRIAEKIQAEIRSSVGIDA